MAWLLDKLIGLALTKNPLNIFYFPTLLWSLLSLDPVYITWCQIYGPGVPAPPVYVAVTKLSAPQPPRRRPTRADMIDQRGDQDKPR